MFNSKNLLVGLVATSISFSMGNITEAIAQVSNRYLSDQEIRSLEPDFDVAALGSSRVRAYTDIRSASEITQVNNFANAWAKADPSISPFLGMWSGWEESYSFYPSQTKGQICAVLTFYDEGGTKQKISIGRVTGDKLLVSGDFGKTTFIRKKGGLIRKQSGVAVPDQKTDIIAQYTTVGSRKSVFTYIFPTRLQEIRDRRFADLGCTASLPSQTQTQSPTQKHPSESIVFDFYTWYFQNSDTYRRTLSQKRMAFTPELYRNLDRAIRISEMPRWSGILNFDVFSNAQVGSYSFQIDSVAPKQDSAEVYVTLQTGLGYSRRRPNPIKVLVSKNNNRWQIADFVYLRDSPNIYSLMSILRGINQRQDFNEIPWGNHENTPSAPSSSTPVRPTDAIAKYPTNEDFKKVDRILRASRNPASLVNLKGNQQNQRRKFQREWESRNPAAAKFLGGWYTGNKSFYVYPSTAKGGTCVVTKDYQGNLTMQIGTVLNRELRYGGGKGFFWIDRENIVASRDSGNGDLYPIYATSEVPELPASIISDMDRQKCITTLPF